MRSVQLIRHELSLALYKAMAALFIMPLLLWGFSHYVLAKGDTAFLANVDRQLAKEPPARRKAIGALYHANPPSTICVSSDPDLAQYRNDFCEPWSDHWQMVWAERIAKLLLATGMLLLAAVAALGWLALRDRSWQYRSLVLGWRMLVTSSALVVVAQGVILVWLSFYVTAYFFHVYYIKLIALMGIVAAVAVFAAVAKMFARAPGVGAVEGEILHEADAPALWARVRALAAQLGTAPPSNIIAGIDDNFFVTQSKLQVQGQVVAGRSLFVSLPLLRVLDQSEADAILVHELAHFSGGDAHNHALLGPKLVQFDRYLNEMRVVGLTLVAYFLLHLYRLVFELALKEDSRQREFLADRAAAGLIGPSAMVTSLIKVVAYSSYRNRVEHAMFAKDSPHREELGIAGFVAQGLRPFAQSEQFLPAMGAAHMPHPFDSHPTMEERMRNVGSIVDGAQIAAVILREVKESWIGAILNAATVEQRLWAAYEERFLRSHEIKLSWRSGIEDEQGRALVEKHFPPLVFPMRGGKTLKVTVDGITVPASGELMRWEQVEKYEYSATWSADIVKVWLPEKGFLNRSKTVKLRLPGARQQRDAIRLAIFNYWQRSRMSRGIA